MDFEHLMELDKSGRDEDLIRECQAWLKETNDPNEKAILLNNLHISYCKLGRLKEARQTLEQIKHVEISDIVTRMQAEFCEAALLLLEGRSEEGLSVFASMLDRHSKFFKVIEHRYVYEEIQWRSALALCGLNRLREALPILREAVSFSYDQTAVEQKIHLWLGVCLEDAKDIEAAKQEFYRVVAFRLKNGSEERALFWLASIYYNSGGLAQAKQHLETILRDFSNDSPAIPRKEVYEALSRTYHCLGDSEEKLYKDLAKRS
jgi:tetratricopeptide (TPR) repeat protein